MYSDTIADLLTRVRNANQARHKSCDCPSSKHKIAVAKVLKDEGYISDYRYIEDPKKKQGTLRVYLKYGPHGEKLIQKLVRVSKPGRRIYRRMEELGKVMDGLGTTVLSTSKGLMSDREARKLNLGGELILKVW